MANNKKAGSSGIIFLTVLILILTLLVAVVIMFLLNIGGMKDTFFSFINGNQDKVSQSLTSEEEKAAALKKEEIRINELQVQLDERKAAIDAKEQQLTEREEKLSLLEAENEELNKRLKGELESFEDIVSIYENMDGQQAAKILSNIKDIDLQVRIIKNLKKETSAAILGLMDPQKAVDIITRMAD